MLLFCFISLVLPLVLLAQSFSGGYCGQNITKANGFVGILLEKNEECAVSFIRPPTEKILINKIRMDNVQVYSYGCCFEILIFAGTTNKSTLISNFTALQRDESFVGVSTNTNTALVTIRPKGATLPSPIFLIRHSSIGPPDNKGNRFIFSSESLLYVWTFKMVNITVNPFGSVLSFNVSIGRTLTVETVNTLSFRTSYNHMLYMYMEYNGTIGLVADDDIIVFSVRRRTSPNDSDSTFIAMPVDAMGTEYRTISSDTDFGNISIGGIHPATSVYITYSIGNGNSSINNITLEDSWKHVELYGLKNLTGIHITSNLPVSVMIDSRDQFVQLPPVNTWGRKFIFVNVPAIFNKTIKLKFISSLATTSISLDCYRFNIKQPITTYVTLANAGDHALIHVTQSASCFISSNKPILPLQIIKDDKLLTEIPNETMTIITPVEQYSNEYVSLYEICSSAENKILVVIVETKYLNGIRINGSHLPRESVYNEIGETGFSSVLFSLPSTGVFHIIRHIQTNVVFGAYQICSKSNNVILIPLGMRMAPIAEKCEVSSSIPGDGIDNDCDGNIDEDLCIKVPSSAISINKNKADCASETLDALPCIGYTDDEGFVWLTTNPNTEVYQRCPSNFTGMVSKFCELLEGISGIWKVADTSRCIYDKLNNLHIKLNLTLNGVSTETLEDVLNETLEVTTELHDCDNLNAGSLELLVSSLNIVTEIIDNRGNGISLNEREHIMSIVDITLSPRLTATWDILNTKINTSNNAAAIMTIVSRFGRQILENQTENVFTLVRENIVLESRQGRTDDIIFPYDAAFNDKTVTETRTFSSSFNAVVFLSHRTIKNNLSGSVNYTAAYYRTLAQLLPTMDGRNVGSDIVALSLVQNSAAQNLEPPVQLRFAHTNTNGTNSTCVFWDFDVSLGGGWSSEGCFPEYGNTTFTSCRCNHLTNFAVLVSASTFSKADTVALTFITWPGCVISVICLLLTIIIYVYFWSSIKSDKSKLMLCLCVTLLLAYIILLVGMDQTGNASRCTAIAIVLHYLFLNALFLMLAEGIEIALTILPSFPQKRSRAIQLLSAGMVPPLLIVGVSMAVTKLDGYGTEQYCWLSVSNGLIFAFLGPCIGVVVTNITITVLIVRKMFTTKAMMKKEIQEKVRASARSIAVLAPLLGLTWLFGILAVHKHLIVFSYLFTILNSFQGVFIFIFHCALNVKLQQAAKRQRNRFAETHAWARSKKTDKFQLTATTDTARTTKPTEATQIKE